MFLPNLSPSLFNAPLAAMVWTAVSFFLILFTAWQTDLKAQKLTRFVLLAESFNLVLTVIGMTIGEGIRFTIIMLGLLFLLLAVPTLIVIKEMNGTYDYSDVLTPAEYEAYKNRKRRTPPKEK